MNITSTKSLVAIGGIGAIGAGVVTASLTGTDRANEAEYHAKLDKMSPEQLKAAAKDGSLDRGRDSAIASLPTFAGVGVAGLGTAGVLYGAVGNTIQGISNVLTNQSGGYMKLAAPIATVVAGLGMSVGGAAVYAGDAVLHRE